MSKINIEFTKTYATVKNAEIAIANSVGPRLMSELKWTIVPVETNNGIRYGILFIGQSAIEEGLHFDFNVIG